MSQVHKDCVLWTQVVNALEAMEKHSWPNGVTSWNDTVKFAQLVFGMNVPMENYWHRLPHASSKSFLLFARGACGPDTPLSQVADLVEPNFGEIAQKEVERGNYNNPLKSQRMQAMGIKCVQFTSNHEDYMHRGSHPVMTALPAYVYNMWVYGARKQSSQDPLGDYAISFDYDVDYKPSALVRTQRLSLIPKIQLEGMHIPSPDVDPHKMSLIKLLLFKPLGQSNDMDEKGIPQERGNSIGKKLFCPKLGMPRKD